MRIEAEHRVPAPQELIHWGFLRGLSWISVDLVRIATESLIVSIRICPETHSMPRGYLAIPYTYHMHLLHMSYYIPCTVSLYLHFLCLCHSFPYIPKYIFYTKLYMFYSLNGLYLLILSKVFPALAGFQRASLMPR